MYEQIYISILITNWQFHVIWKLIVEVAVSDVMLNYNNTRSKMSIEGMNKSYDLGVISLIYNEFEANHLKMEGRRNRTVRCTNVGWEIRNRSTANNNFKIECECMIRLIYVLLNLLQNQQQKCSWSEDSGFESRAGLTKTCWPNGKASDYGRCSWFFYHGRWSGSFYPRNGSAKASRLPVLLLLNESYLLFTYFTLYA